MTPLEILTRAREHISDLEMWYQGEFAPVTEGEDPLDAVYEGKPCCALGAIIWTRFQDSGIHYGRMELYATNLLLDAIRDVKGDRFTSVPYFNDHPNTTHAEVLEAFDLAIEKARNV